MIITSNIVIIVISITLRRRDPVTFRKIETRYAVYMRTRPVARSGIISSRCAQASTAEAANPADRRNASNSVH